MSKRRKLIIGSIILCIVTVLYTLIVKKVDLSPIGPNDSVVGLSTLNNWFYNANGVNDMWYKITEYLGVIPFIICAFYGLKGLQQLIKHKSIKKVDKRLIYLAILYVAMGIVYIFFEKVIINYRPVLEDGVLEASYPSSHTVLAVCICLSSLLISKYYIKNPTTLKVFDSLTWILLVFIVGGRILSGYHWLSDIIGGILISLFLVTTYYAFSYSPKKLQK